MLQWVLSNVWKHFVFPGLRNEKKSQLICTYCHILWCWKFGGCLKKHQLHNFFQIKISIILWCFNIITSPLTLFQIMFAKMKVWSGFFLFFLLVFSLHTNWDEKGWIQKRRYFSKKGSNHSAAEHHQTVKCYGNEHQFLKLFFITSHLLKAVEDVAFRRVALTAERWREKKLIHRAAQVYTDI